MSCQAILGQNSGFISLFGQFCQVDLAITWFDQRGIIFQAEILIK